MVEKQYKTFWRRFGSMVIDTLLFVPFSWLDQMIITTFSQGVALFWLSLSSCLFLLYSILMHGLLGQTVGKMVFRIRVLDLSEQKLAFRQAFLRDLVPVCMSIMLIEYMRAHPDFWFQIHLGTLTPEGVAEVSLEWFYFLNFFVLFWSLLELGTMLLNRKRRAIHDFIARSVVVRDS
jgi:uncharacterized RDD family membrane protein YckC